ncbi:heterochromatin protein 1-binding protein 3 [Plakobranchus ocellatus]|uniref:Heterochromatin protein 1-binding protein 3 n=1 Tax=Plakobranchus ocellatus TaxID=259542 RepID=A0AAV3YAX2_9GAST|nr:heterochromatin protein 1-binding protein 3 [Plakobranchus ocellatus]
MILRNFHQLYDTFSMNIMFTKHLNDMICAAIIACHEPKAASGHQIKKYISRYHPDFQVDSKPDRFKKALIRAAERNMIVQVSGIGANGSFQLCESFVPSPRVLSGEAASSSEDESDSSDEEPVYVSKGTKSRGVPKKKLVKKREVKKPGPVPKKAASVRKLVSKIKAKLKPGLKAGNKVGKGTFKRRDGKSSPDKVRKKSFASSNDSVDLKEEPVHTPRKSQSGRGPSRLPSAKKSPKSKRPLKPGRRQNHTDSPSHDEEDADILEEKPEYTPRKSQSRGGPGRNTVQEEQKVSTKKPKNKSENSSPVEKRNRAKGGGSFTTLKMNFAEDGDDADADSEPEYTPRKSSSRGGGERDQSLSSNKAKGKKKSKKRP